MGLNERPGLRRTKAKEKKEPEMKGAGGCIRLKAGNGLWE